MRAATRRARAAPRSRHGRRSHAGAAAGRRRRLRAAGVNTALSIKFFLCDFTSLSLERVQLLRLSGGLLFL